jgi:signal transduction histidine kinase
MDTLQHTPGDAVPLESVLCTEELQRRPSRPPDYQAENRALVTLAQALADAPSTILQTLADTILAVLQADSAGVSLLTPHDGGKTFYWPAIAGAWHPHIGGGTPRDFGPCGDVLDRNSPLLFRHFERRYTYFQPVTPPTEECLLVPFYVAGTAVGTIWAITHHARRQFDAEDQRQLVSLGRFASAAYQAQAELAERRRAEAALAQAAAVLEQRVEERTTALHQALVEQERLERDAQRAQHFAMLGRLAAGLSHEIRNPLSALFLHIDVLEEELHQPTPDSVTEIAEALGEIRTNLARLEDLLQDYLTLVRTPQIEPTPQDLGAAVQRWVPEWQALLTTRGVALHHEGIRELGHVRMHESTLRRAVFNLVQNAADAMPHGGTLTLRGEWTPTEVHLRICDTGSGILAASLPKIFEPLYTTKPGGTGLGLHVVQEIVTAHAGRLSVESVEGHGTTFTITLPCDAEGTAAV